MDVQGTLRTLIAILVSELCFTGLARAQTTEGPPPPAEAQQQSPGVTTPAPDAAVQASEPGAPRKSAEEQIQVTGTRIRRKDLTTPAPITVITREQVAASGKVSIGDFLQSLPEQGNAINTQVNNGGNGATRVALRGLGTARTLVLLNGRRFVPGGNGANDSVDLNSIPVGAIERIEVLKDGASAVYGSDAIGGVVNLITRKRSGTDLSAYAGTSAHADGSIYDFNGTTGASGDAGNFLFSGGFYKQQPAWAGARDFSAIPLAYDGTGTRTLTGRPGTYSQGSTTVPAGTIVLGNCTSKTPASTPCVGRQMPMSSDPVLNQRIALWNALMARYPNAGAFIFDPSSPQSIGGYRPFTSALLPADGGDGYNFQPDNYLITPSQRISLFSSGDTRLGGSARAYFEASFVNRQSQQKLAPEPLLTDGAGLTVSKDDIFNPFGVDLSAVRRRLLEFSNRIATQDINTIRAVAGVNGSLPDEAGPLKGWYWDLSLNYGRSEGTQVRSGNLRTTALAQALGPSFHDPATGVNRCGTPTAPIDNCVPLNLFGGAGTISEDQIAGLTFTGTLRALNQMTSVLFNTSGDLFSLFTAERPVGLAAGYEYRFLSGENVPDPITVAGETTGNAAQITAGHYYVNEAYAELSVPVLANRPLAEDVEATAAVRVSDYNTFGGRVTYKFGGRWRIVRDVTVRGTYSTGFRAPSIADLFQGQGDSFPPVSDPCRGRVAGGSLPVPPNCIAQGLPATGTGDAQTQLRTKIGGNPDLQPEKAQIFTAGVVLEPRMVKNLSITVDYYNVNVDNTITTFGASTILSGCYPSDGSPPNQTYCDLIQRDPITGRIKNITNRNVNVGKDYTDGIDLALQYAVPTEYGRFGYVFDGTWLHRYNRRLADGTLIKGKGNFDLNNQGTGGVYPAFKFLNGITWGYLGFGAGVNMRYVSSFTECGTATGNYNGNGLCYVNDAFQRRVEHFDQWDVYASYTLRTQAGRTTLAAGVNNLFDRAPSAIYNGFTAASDPTAYDFMGRFIYGRLTHAF